MDLKIYYLILFNFILFSLGQLTALSRSGGGFNIYLFDLLLILTNIILFIFIFRRGKFEINFPLIVFIFFTLFSFFYTFGQIYYFPFFDQFRVFGYLLRFCSYFIFAYFIYILLSSNLFQLPDLKKILVFNFYFLTILNLLQLIFLNNLTELSLFGWDPHIGRLTGTFLDPNFMAYYLCLYYLLNHYVLKNKYIEILTIFSIFLTLSRNGIITFLVILIILNLRNIQKLILISLLVFSLILFNSRILERFMQFSDSNDSSYVRLISWNEALKTFSLNNYSGVGFNNYNNNLRFYRTTELINLYKNSSTSTDSSFLHIVVSLGIVGLILTFLLLISLTFKKSIIEMNLILLISLFFNSQFINSFFFPQICIFIFLVMFLGYYLKSLEN